MGQIKKRDYMFDTFRGLLMWCIPISHFTRVAGHFSQASLSGIIYITINVFVMQAFVFLSGYFSKKPDRARQTAFHTFMWPYLLCIPFFFFIRTAIFGHATLNVFIPPFALWYLFALFFYRFFLRDYIKIPHIFEISMVIYLLAGMIPFFSDELALGRMFSYFPFFILGYYCTEEHIKKLRSLKKWHCAVLGAVLLAVSCVLAFFGDQFPVGYFLLKSPAVELGMVWYWDILGRFMIFFLACGWIILMFNILPSKNNYVSYVGRNTMTIYILHLIVRYLVKKNGISFGIFPDNVVVYYLSIFVLAGLCVFVLSLKPVVKLYDFVVEGLYKVFKWLLKEFAILMKLLHKPLYALANGVIELVFRAGGSYESRKHLGLIPKSEIYEYDFEADLEEDGGAATAAKADEARGTTGDIGAAAATGAAGIGEAIGKTGGIGAGTAAKVTEKAAEKSVSGIAETAKAKAVADAAEGSNSSKRNSDRRSKRARLRAENAKKQENSEESEGSNAAPFSGLASGLSKLFKGNNSDNSESEQQPEKRSERRSGSDMDEPKRPMRSADAHKASDEHKHSGEPLPDMPKPLDMSEVSEIPESIDIPKDMNDSDETLSEDEWFEILFGYKPGDKKDTKDADEDSESEN